MRVIHIYIIIINNCLDVIHYTYIYIYMRVCLVSLCVCAVMCVCVSLVSLLERTLHCSDILSHILFTSNCLGEQHSCPKLLQYFARACGPVTQKLPEMPGLTAC